MFGIHLGYFMSYEGLLRVYFFLVGGKKDISIFDLYSFPIERCARGLWNGVKLSLLFYNKFLHSLFRSPLLILGYYTFQIIINAKTLKTIFFRAPNLEPAYQKP